MYKNGFTFLEIMLIIGLLAILFFIIIFSINPNVQIAKIRNSKRQADVLSIYTAINQYRDANSGQLPIGITNQAKAICQEGCIESEGLNPQIDISTELNPYLRFNRIPIDPLQTGIILTSYMVYVNDQGRVVVSAPLAENGVIIDTVN